MHSSLRGPSFSQCTRSLSSKAIRKPEQLHIAYQHISIRSKTVHEVPLKWVSRSFKPGGGEIIIGPNFRHVLKVHIFATAACRSASSPRLCKTRRVASKQWVTHFLSTLQRLSRSARQVERSQQNPPADARL